MSKRTDYPILCNGIIRKINMTITQCGIREETGATLVVNGQPIRARNIVKPYEMNTHTIKPPPFRLQEGDIITFMPETNSMNSIITLLVEVEL